MLSKSVIGNSHPFSFNSSYTATNSFSSGSPRNASAHVWIYTRHRVPRDTQCNQTTGFKRLTISNNSCYLPKQESLANANVSARQQCMYEGHYRRNLSSVKNSTVEANIMSLSCKQPMLFYPVTMPGYFVGLYEIFLVLNRCPCNRKNLV